MPRLEVYHSLTGSGKLSCAWILILYPLPSGLPIVDGGTLRLTNKFRVLRQVFC